MLLLLILYLLWETITIREIISVILNTLILILWNIFYCQFYVFSGETITIPVIPLFSFFATSFFFFFEAAGGGECWTMSVLSGNYLAK